MNFRLPQDLRDKLQAASEEANRTLTAEIVSRLEASFGAETSLDEAERSLFNTMLMQLQTTHMARNAAVPRDAQGIARYLDQLEQQHQEIEALKQMFVEARRIRSERSTPVLKRPVVIPEPPCKPGDPILRDPRTSKKR